MADTRPLTLGIVLAVTMFAFDALAITTVMPAVAADLDGVTLYGATFSAFMVTSILSMVIGGDIVDRVGPGPVLGFGCATFVAGLALGGLAPTMAMVVAARALQGLGAGTVGSTVYATVGRAYPEDRRSRMFAITSAAWVIPSLVGPAAAGHLADTVGWRWVFGGLIPVPVAVAVLALPAMIRLGPPAASPSTLDGRGAGLARARAAVVLASGLALGLGVTSGSGSIPGVLRVAGVVVGAGVSIVSFARLMPPGVWRGAPGVAAAVAARAVLSAVFFGVDTFIPLVLTELHGRSTTVAGLVVTTGSLAWAVGAWQQSRLADRRSLPWLARLGWLFLAAGVAAMSAQLASSVAWQLSIPAWMLAGLGMGLAYNSITVAGMAHAPSGREGRVGAQLQVADAVAIAVAAAVGGGVIAYGDDIGRDVGWALSVPWALAVAATWVGAAASSRMSRPPRSSPEV